MPNYPGLTCRGDTYYCRFRIPVDIKPSYPKSEEKESLHTKDANEALRRIKLKAVQIDEKFEAHRRERRLSARMSVR